MSQQLAYEHNGRRVTREQFYAIACDPARSVAVEACAGAGKTWMLVSRILRALLAGAKPHEILAITFTKKAAGEMRQRLHEWLEHFAACSDEERLQALISRGVSNENGPQAASTLRGVLQNLYQTLLAEGRPVQIRTFHSWFAALLRTAPLAVLDSLGLPANYELLEDDAEAIQRVWRRFFVAVAGEPEARADYEAAVAAHGRFQTQKGLLAALDKRVEFALADTHGVVDACIEPWTAQFPEFEGFDDPGQLLAGSAAVRGTFTEAARALGRATQVTFSAKGSELEQALTAGFLPGVLEALLTQKGERRKFSDKLAGIEAIREAQQLALRIAAAADQHAAWLHQRRMARLARLLIAQFGELKREHGWIDMNDVERAAFVLLGDPVLSGWVQERLDARVAHLLIDEFQDTNPLQWQALHAWLSAYAGAGGSGGAPSVFIVGDPKQSIYRFRRAEPQVFRAAQHFVAEGLGGDLLACDHTHRNAPEVMTAVNEVMLAAQAAGEYEGFRPHTTESKAAGRIARLPQVPRTARGEKPLAEPLAWRDTLATPRELPEEKLVALECRQAAAWVAQRIASGRAPGEIMVLARRRDRLAAMEDALRALHIPAQQPEKVDLSETPEIQDIVALLDVLVSPTHDLSLARALKSPLFGLPDEALVELALAARRSAQAGAPRTWFDLLQKEELPGQWWSGLAADLARWKGWVDKFPPHDALEAIYREADVLAKFAQAAPPALRAGIVANLRALPGAALAVGGGRYATPYAFVRALKAGGLPGPALAAAEAVRLLTVHGAKGLEAPVVLMLDTDAPPARSETMGVIVEWPGEAPSPERFAFLASESRPPACSAEAMQVEFAARKREELNALYVAMTRARSELVISSVEPHIAAAGSWWQRLSPLAEALETPVPADAAAPAASGAFLMPNLPASRTHIARAAIETIASQPPPTPESLFGEAMHRLLETRRGAGFEAAQLARVRREFGLDEAAAAQAAAMAERILQGEGAWAWSPREVDWQGNEVELFHRGDRLRLDRLVRHAHSGEWWVFDYKSAGRPESQPELRAQLLRYREAVAAAHPGQRVRAAFLTGTGRLVELP